MEEFLAVGIVQNVHGIKGELKVGPLTDDINRFKKLKKVFIKGEERSITSVKLQPKTAIVKIEGIDTRDDAIRLKGEYLKVDRENAVKLPEGRYFAVDIVGCEVIDENNKIYGKVDEVIFTGANDVYWIKRKKEEDLLIPVIDDIVFDINVADKKIIIKPVELWM